MYLPIMLWKSNSKVVFNAENANLLSHARHMNGAATNLISGCSTLLPRLRLL